MALATPTAATPTRQRPLGRTRSPASSPARRLSGGHKRPIGPPVTGDRLSARPGGAAHVPDGSAPRSACHRLVNGPPIRSGTPGPHTRHPPLRVRPHVEVVVAMQHRYARADGAGGDHDHVRCCRASPPDRLPSPTAKAPGRRQAQGLRRVTLPSGVFASTLILRDANLAAADLIGADPVDADLRRANLTAPDLRAASLVPPSCGV